MENVHSNCRTCAKHFIVEESVSIGSKICDNKSILDFIKEWGVIQAADDDKLPQFICKLCFISLKSFINFIKLVQKADQEFRELLRKNEQTNSPKHSTRAKDKCGNPKKLPDNRLDMETSHLAKEPHRLECITCRKTFKKPYQYKSHMAVHTGERKFSCQICGKSFARSYVLIYHMRVHTGEKKFKCCFCNKAFIHPSNLYKHKKIHTNTRNFTCEFCSKSFIQSESLKIHVRRIHTGEKPFLCEICSKSFSCQSSLLLHKQDSHLQKENCPLCNKQFSSRILKLHIERHKNKEQQIIKCICDQCGKNFSSVHNLKQHLLIHDGIKPYASQPIPCPLCKKSYSKRRIKNHICISANS